MRCGNVREIFIFIQRASRGGGKAKAGRTQLHPCQESCRSQNASNSVAKHFSREKKQKPEWCWLYGSFYLILGSTLQSSNAWVSPKRGDDECERQQLDNEVLGEKGTSGESYGSSGATVNPARWEGTWAKVVLPQEAGHFNTALVCHDFVQCWHSICASDFFQKAARSSHKADTAASATCDLCFWSLLQKPASNAGKNLKPKKIKKKIPPKQQQQKSLTQQHPKKQANPQNSWSKYLWRGRRGTDTSAIKAEFVKALAAALTVYKHNPQALHTT